MLGGTIASKNRVIQLFFFNSTRISILNNQAIRFANIYFELHTWSCILAKTYSYILDCTVHSVNLSLILILILILTLTLILILILILSLILILILILILKLLLILYSDADDDSESEADADSLF